MALSANSNRPYKGEPLDILCTPVNAGSHIYKGGLVTADTDGYSRPGADTAGFTFRGVAIEEFNQTGADGAALSDGRTGCRVARTGATYRFAKHGTIVQADIGSKLYVYDDDTVALAADVSNLVECGTLDSIDGSYVWLRLAAAPA